MASPTAATMRGEAQLLVQDTSSTNAGLSNANWLVLFNIALRWFYDNTEKRVKSVTLVTSFSGSAIDATTDAAAIYPEIMEVQIDAGGGLKKVVDRMGWSELRYRQRVDTTEAEPTHVAMVKKAGAATNTWLIALYPIPNAVYLLTGLVRDYPTALTGDSDVIELGDHEARIVVILAAILACQLLARPDLSEKLVSLLPQMMQDKMASFVTHDEIKTMERAAA